jgi:hypothetical protein
VTHLESLKLKRTILITALLVIPVLATKAAIGEEALTRPCVAGDLRFTYVLADFWEIPPNRGFTIYAQQFPYKFLAFYPPVAWSEQNSTSMSANPTASAAELRRQLQGRSYTIQPASEIVFNRGRSVAFPGTCAVSLQTRNGFQENYLIVNGHDAEEPRETHKLYRRWNGGPVERPTSAFDPVPSAAQQPPQPAAGLADVQPTLPDEALPLPANVTHSNGPNGLDTQVWEIVTGLSQAPLKAFMLVSRGQQMRGRWKDLYVDACVMRLRVWQSEQQWAQYLGMPIEVGNIQVKLGAALFSDDSPWGNPHRLALLLAHHGRCTGPDRNCRMI